MKVEISMPKVGRRRLIGTTALASTGALLWLTPGLLDWPGAALTPMLTVFGVAIPFGVGALTLTLLERRVARDLGPAERRELPKHDQAVAR